MKNIRVLIGLFIGAAGFCACNQNVKNTDSENPVVKNQDVVIDYTDTHSGDTTLLFVHGWCINKTYWDDQIAYFKNHYRVVAIDLPGFGKSGKNQKAWNSETFGTDVSAVIDQLQLKNVILIGHSMAGDIVLQAATHSPKQIIGLVGVDNFKEVAPAKIPSKADTIAYGKVIDSLRHDFKTVAFKYVNQQLFYRTTSPAIKTRILNDVAKADPNIAASCLVPDSFSEAGALKRYGKKLYMINSDYIPTDTAGFRKNNIPFKMLTIHATGHFPMVEKPKDFNQALTEVIKSIKD